MEHRKEARPHMTATQKEQTKRILDQVATDRMNSQAERSYREFVTSINKAKDSEIASALRYR